MSLLLKIEQISIVILGNKTTTNLVISCNQLVAKNRTDFYSYSWQQDNNKFSNFL